MSIEALLGDPNKVRMLLALYAGGRMKKTDLYDKIKFNNQNAQKLNELEKMGLITMKIERFENNRTCIELTEKGSRFVRTLIAADAILADLSPEPETNASGLTSGDSGESGEHV